MNERIVKLIDQLPEERNKARRNIEESQDKQKKYHDQNIKKKSQFHVGEKVLLYDAAKEKQWSGKLNEKWKGPYYIHKEVSKGSYQIKEINGKILKKPVNGELLKRYHSRGSFEPMVVI